MDNKINGDGENNNVFADPVKLRLGKGDNVRAYALYPIPPGNAVFFMPKVVKAFSGVLNLDGLSINQIQNMSKDDMTAMAKMFINGVQGIDPEAISLLGREALKHEVYAGSQKLYEKNSNSWHHFDDWFSKYPQDMMQVMGWAIWENAKPFFPGGSELINSLVDRAKQHAALQSQKDGSQSTKSEES